MSIFFLSLCYRSSVLRHCHMHTSHQGPPPTGGAHAGDMHGSFAVEATSNVKIRKL